MEFDLSLGSVRNSNRMPGNSAGSADRAMEFDSFMSNFDWRCHAIVLSLIDPDSDLSR